MWGPYELNLVKLYNHVGCPHGAHEGNPYGAHEGSPYGTHNILATGSKKVLYWMPIQAAHIEPMWGPYWLNQVKLGCPYGTPLEPVAKFIWAPHGLSMWAPHVFPTN